MSTEKGTDKTNKKQKVKQWFAERLNLVGFLNKFAELTHEPVWFIPLITIAYVDGCISFLRTTDNYFLFIKGNNNLLTKERTYQ